MDALIENVNIAAMVLGYPALIVIVAMTLWFGSRLFRDISKIFNEMRYERWKRRHAERDWSNIESSWALEPYEDEDEPYIPVQRNLYNRHDTLEFPENFAEELYNYQEDRT